MLSLERTISDRMKILIYLCAFFCLSGCAIIRHREQLSTLKRIGANRQKASQYIERQEKLFYVLLGDVRDNKLKKGSLKKRILGVYGDPVLYRDVEGDAGGAVEELLYRHPTKYFSSERIYMYFDSEARLTRWEYYP
ncbi:MAG: hypothetical protein JSV34_04800 [Candidatus Omnitrophota bacterium]|nr:MAG: hypothetical protein JSV34_04800 [Candidatus Omnitrophota bacterium]